MGSYRDGLPLCTSVYPRTFSALFNPLPKLPNIHMTDISLLVFEAIKSCFSSKKRRIAARSQRMAGRQARAPRQAAARPQQTRSNMPSQRQASSQQRVGVPRCATSATQTDVPVPAGGMGAQAPYMRQKPAPLQRHPDCYRPQVLLDAVSTEPRSTRRAREHRHQRELSVSLHAFYTFYNPSSDECEQLNQYNKYHIIPIIHFDTWCQQYQVLLICSSSVLHSPRQETKGKLLSWEQCVQRKRICYWLGFHTSASFVCCGKGARRAGCATVKPDGQVRNIRNFVLLYLKHATGFDGIMLFL